MEGQLTKALIYAMPVVVIAFNAVLFYERSKLERPGIFEFNYSWTTCAAFHVFVLYIVLLFGFMSEGW